MPAWTSTSSRRASSPNGRTRDARRAASGWCRSRSRTRDSSTLCGSIRYVALICMCVCMCVCIPSSVLKHGLHIRMRERDPSPDVAFSSSPLRVCLGRIFFLFIIVSQLLAMIGEQFEDGNEICGAVVSVRQKQDRIAIWTRTATNEETQIHIGRKLKEFVDVGDNVKIGYLVHEDAKQMDRRAKDRYTV